MAKPSDSGTLVVNRKAKPVKALKNGKQTLRVKVTDIWTEPAKLKEDRDKWKLEAIALRVERDALSLERDALQERIAQLEKANDVVPEFVDEVEVVAGEEVAGVGVDHNVGFGVDQNVGVAVEQNVVGGGHLFQPLACSVPFEEFQLFLKFKKFLNFEHDQQESNGHHTSHAQEPADLQTSAQLAQPADSAQDAKGPSFMTLPNGNVLEVIDVGVF